MKELRADRNGPHRVAFEKNKKILLKTQNTCGICGQPVDKSLRYPHPLSPVIDHIIPVNRNGHPSDIKNLQLAHWQCNRQKSDKLYAEQNFEKNAIANSLTKEVGTNGKATLRTDYGLTEEEFKQIAGQVVTGLGNNQLQGTYWLGVIHITK